MVVCASTALLAAIIVLYAGLIGLGQWAPDEYDDFGRLAHNGLRAISERLRWSPRPVSELLFGGYGWLVNRTHRPLIALFLGLLWAGFIAAGLLTPFIVRCRRAEDDARRDLLIALALMASFVTAGPLTEVFYWPAGAVAYLTTLAATLLLFLQAADGQLDVAPGRMRCGIALTLAALSSEMGAMFVLVYGGTLGVSAVADLARGRPTVRHLRPTSWWIWPTLAALAVLAAVRLNRFAAAQEPARKASATLGHPVASAIAALGRLAGETFGPGASGHGWLFLNVRFVSAVLLAMGIALACCRKSGGSIEYRRDLARLAGAFALASLLTLTAAYLHFGQAMGERHRLMIRCWVLMALAAVGIAVIGAERFRGFRERRVLRTIYPLMLAVSVVMVWHVKPLVREYRVYGEVRRAIAYNFRSGFNAPSRQMEWCTPRHEGVITAPQLQPGIYTRESGTSFARYVLIYFDKDVLVVHPAGNHPADKASPQE